MKVYITPEAKQRLDLYVDAVSGEISGLGKATIVSGNLFIEDVYLLEQESGGADTELKPEAVSELINELLAEGEDPQHVKLWWHSHGSMGVFWSGTDDKTAEGFANGWMLSLVLNKKGEYKSRLDVYEPVHLVADNLEMVVAYPEADAQLKAEIAEEVKEKVKSKSYMVVGGADHRGGWGVNRTGYGGYGGYSGWNGGGHHKQDDKYLEGWEKGDDGIWIKKPLTAEEVKAMMEEEESWNQMYGY
jgi:hypothetical protein